MQTEIADLESSYEKVCFMLEQKGLRKKTRENTQTTYEDVFNRNDSKYFSRRKETRNIMEYIHGGEKAARIGALDFSNRMQMNLKWKDYL